MPAGWGATCALLDRTPLLANRSAGAVYGYHKNISSWGGNVVVGDDGVQCGFTWPPYHSTRPTPLRDSVRLSACRSARHYRPSHGTPLTPPPS